MNVIARIGKPHGIRGEVTVEVRTDDPDARFTAGAEFTTDPDIGVLSLERARWHKDRLLLTFKEIADRNRAEELRNTLLLTHLADEDTDGEGYYEKQLVGLAAMVDERKVGTVSGLVYGAVQDLLQVTTEDGREVLVPFVEQIVPQVDPENGIVVITPPGGLFDDDVAGESDNEAER